MSTASIEAAGGAPHGRRRCDQCRFSRLSAHVRNGSSRGKKRWKMWPHISAATRACSGGGRSVRGHVATVPRLAPAPSIQARPPAPVKLQQHRSAHGPRSIVTFPARRCVAFKHEH